MVSYRRLSSTDSVISRKTFGRQEIVAGEDFRAFLQKCYEKRHKRSIFMKLFFRSMKNEKKICASHSSVHISLCPAVLHPAFT